MNPKEKAWLKSCIDYLLKMHGGGESIRMINVAFMPERPAGVFPDDEKAKQALFAEIARVAEEGKLLKPQPIGDTWRRPGKPPLVMKVEQLLGMARLGRLLEADPFLQNRVRVAVNTLRMPDAMLGVMGGMSKAQARDVLRFAGWPSGKIAGLEGRPFEKRESGPIRGTGDDFDTVYIDKEGGQFFARANTEDGPVFFGRGMDLKALVARAKGRARKVVVAEPWGSSAEEGAWPLMSEPSR